MGPLLPLNAEKVRDGEIYQIRLHSEHRHLPVGQFHQALAVYRRQPETQEIGYESEGSVIPFPQQPIFVHLIAEMFREIDGAECWITCSPEDAKAIISYYRQKIDQSLRQQAPGLLEEQVRHWLLNSILPQKPNVQLISWNDSPSSPFKVLPPEDESAA